MTPQQDRMKVTARHERLSRHGGVTRQGGAMRQDGAARHDGRARHDGPAQYGWRRLCRGLGTATALVATLALTLATTNLATAQDLVKLKAGMVTGIDQVGLPIAL